MYIVGCGSAARASLSVEMARERWSEEETKSSRAASWAVAAVRVWCVEAARRPVR